MKAPERARAIFSDLDFDGDGMITEEEFVLGRNWDRDNSHSCVRHPSTITF